MDLSLIPLKPKAKKPMRSPMQSKAHLIQVFHSMQKSNSQSSNLSHKKTKKELRVKKNNDSDHNSNPFQINTKLRKSLMIQNTSSDSSLFMQKLHLSGYNSINMDDSTKISQDRMKSSLKSPKRSIKKGSRKPPKILKRFYSNK